MLVGGKLYFVGLITHNSSIAQRIAIAMVFVGIRVMRARSGPAARPGPNTVAVAGQAPAIA